MASEHRNAFAWQSAITIFWGALLLFQVQPLISKMILPWFGGSSAVWTTCMLFFQVALLGGYAYAHLLTRLRRPAVQGLVHITLVVAALATLPITRAEWFKPDDSTGPTWKILLLLALTVGPTYFVLATTGPLVQAWFARVYHDRSPYRLYALSNVGSLLALISYPILMEPLFSTFVQGWIWSGSFVLYAALAIGLAASMWRQAGQASPPEEPSDSAPAKTKKGGKLKQPRNVATAEFKDVGWRDVAAWLLLPAFASLMLLAVTNHISQNIAVIPFLWVAPLCLYLISFIISFDRDQWYIPRWHALGAIVVILVISDLVFMRNTQSGGSQIADSIPLQIGVHLLMLFFVCMVCHGEVARRRPRTTHITAFYLCVATGGAIGGILVAIVCPLVFRSYIEFSLGIVISLPLAAFVLCRDAWKTWFENRQAFRILAVVGSVVGLAAAGFAQWNGQQGYWSIWMERDFYGVLTVEENHSSAGDLDHGYSFFSGNTRHGYQFLSPGRRMEPTTYFVEQSGVGLALRGFPRQENMRVGVIGLGIGTVAAYGSPGDYYRFYEINPSVKRLAENDKYFSFLKDSPARIEVILGDARLSMEREDPQQFDVLILDAFTGDTIPTHLLTAEAFAVYQRHMKTDGILAVHISNRYLDLVPVVARLAEHYQLPAFRVLRDKVDEQLVHSSPSQWVLITNNEEFLQSVTPLPSVKNLSRQSWDVPLWTDQYSNVFQLMW